jgi:hypothetical protein
MLLLMFSTISLKKKENCSKFLRPTMNPAEGVAGDKKKNIYKKFTFPNKISSCHFI